jgi:putative phosphoribosyl transferase
MGGEDGDAGLPFEDREEGARRLLSQLEDLKGQNPLVLGVPRGAIPMAGIIADGLGGELDMILVKKVGHPRQPEFAVGAVTEDGEIILDLGAREGQGITQEEIGDAALRQVEVLRKRRAEIAHGRRPVDPKDRVVVIVDDGIATGATMSAAVQSVKAKGARRIIVAAPVASRRAVTVLELAGAEVRAVAIPKNFGAVGYYYRSFAQVSDAEVGAFFKVKPAAVEVGALKLKGVLALPEGASGLVLFAHGSGSGRLSPRNQFVAEMLNKQGIATLLVDLLTEEEALDRANIFDIDLLADRLIEITHWIGERESLRSLTLGYFGASTGAGAALAAAAELGGVGRVAAVVSRGGRPDLAGQRLEEVQAPALLIVGGDDEPVIELNQRAYQRLRCERKIEIVAGATHLFEEPGTLEIAAELATAWFQTHFAAAGTAAGRPSPSSFQE